MVNVASVTWKIAGSKTSVCWEQYTNAALRVSSGRSIACIPLKDPYAFLWQKCGSRIQAGKLILFTKPDVYVTQRLVKDTAGRLYATIISTTLGKCGVEVTFPRIPAFLPHTPLNLD